MMAIAARITPEPFDPAAELDELTRSAGDVGAIATFVGIARSVSKAGERLDGLVLEHHPRLTLSSVEEIAEAAAVRFGLDQVRVVHRFGEIGAGEPIVFAGAASAHRRAAIEAVDYLMDRLKTEAVFWKLERTSSGGEWIEPTGADYADRNRWE